MFRGKLLFMRKYFGAHELLGNVSSVHATTRESSLQLEKKLPSGGKLVFVRFMLLIFCGSCSVYLVLCIL